MNIIIYPSPNKKLNVNEKLLAYPLKHMFSNDVYWYEDDKISSMEEEFKNTKHNINKIIILLDCYGFFIKQNINFILENKHITFYILENDLHYLPSKINTYNRYLLLRNKLIDNKHIIILAYYWYDYNKKYKINDGQVLCFPKFVMNHNINYTTQQPIMKVLLSGAITKIYPMRKYLNNLSLTDNNYKNKIHVLKQADGVYGDNYITYLNTFICCFTCCSNKNTPYIIAKFFEIPISRSLLLAYDEFIKEPLKELGFIDGENYISCNLSNIKEKIDYICDIKNIDEINKIRYNGYLLVKNNHTLENRYKFIKQLLNKNNKDNNNNKF